MPELSLWLFRAMTRYREDCNKEKDYDSLNDLNYLTPNDSAQDRDFLSTAVRLMDFLSDHRNLFTQISKINNSGRSSIDWHKTIQQDAFVHKGKPFYLDLQIKNKAINIDEELARLDGADYDLACAILTALMREGYFCGENWFQRRVKNGLFDKAIGRVISLLEESL